MQATHWLGLLPSPTPTPTRCRPCRGSTRLLLLPGAAQLANIEPADAFNDAVLDFLIEPAAR